MDESAWKTAWIRVLVDAFSSVQPDFRESLVWNAIPLASRRKGSLIWNVYEHVAVQIQIDPSHTFGEKVKRALQAVDYAALTNVRPEAKGVVHKLARRYYLGFMANQNRAIRRKLDEAGILVEFANVQMSDDVGLEKPDPDYFRAVLRLCGAKASQSILIDDNPERGLRPARRLGFSTIWLRLPEPIPWRSNAAQFEISALSKVLALLPG